MPTTYLDHITVTCPTLESGAAFVHAALGVEPQVGGEHPCMATHNLLLRLGDALFLEVIAPNPAAPAPSLSRWFGLDQFEPLSPPRLATWVVRTADILASVIAASDPLGSVEQMRRGAFDWLITIPADGSLPLDGAGPALIEWQTCGHPANRMEDKGPSLACLEISHPDPARIARLQYSLALQGPVQVCAGPMGSGTQLVAHIDTPWARKCSQTRARGRPIFGATPTRPRLLPSMPPCRFGGARKRSWHWPNAKGGGRLNCHAAVSG